MVVIYYAGLFDKFDADWVEIDRVIYSLQRCLMKFTAFVRVKCCEWSWKANRVAGPQSASLSHVSQAAGVSGADNDALGGDTRRPANDVVSEQQQW